MTVQHTILQKFTNFHAILSWSFQNICNEIGWPRFLRHPYNMLTFDLTKYVSLALALRIMALETKNSEKKRRQKQEGWLSPPERA